MLPAGNTWFGSEVDGVVDEEVEAGKVENIVAGLDGDVDEESLPLCLEGRTAAVLFGDDEATFLCLRAAPAWSRLRLMDTTLKKKSHSKGC